jgi:hypothetical protein
MPVLQTTTKISSYTSDTQAQDYYDECDPLDPTTWPPCDICECDYDYDGYCCCDVYDCFCSLCSEEYYCSDGHVCPDDPTTWDPTSWDSSGIGSSSGNWVMDNILTPIGDAISDIFAAVWDGTTWAADLILDSVVWAAEQIWDSAVWAAEQIWDGLTWVWDGLTYLADAIGNGIQDLINTTPPESVPCNCNTCPICGGCLDSMLKSASTADPNPNCPTPCPGHIDPYIATIIFCNKVTIPFLEACQSVANNIGIDVNYLMAAMAFETGETFSPTIENPSSCAVGLIQFTPIVCGELGTTMVDLRGMSNIEQLAVVEDYFQLQERRRGDIQSLEDVYMAILCPAAIGKSNDYALYSSPSTAYTQNSGLDANGDGEITKTEASQKVWGKYNRGLDYTCN